MATEKGNFEEHTDRQNHLKFHTRQRVSSYIRTLAPL